MPSFLPPASNIPGVPLSQPGAHLSMQILKIPPGLWEEKLRLPLTPPGSRVTSRARCTSGGLQGTTSRCPWRDTSLHLHRELPPHSHSSGSSGVKGYPCITHLRCSQDGEDP